MTRSRLYQSVTSAASSQNYSEVDYSIMSVLSEVLNLRSDSRASRSGQSAAEPQHHQHQRSVSRLETIEEDNSGVDKCSLLHTIEEIRNNSLCNLYYSSSSDLNRPQSLPPQVPLVPPRNTAGYESLVKENQQGSSKTAASVAAAAVGAAAVPSTSLEPHEQAVTDLNESIKSVQSNTLVLTPPTVKASTKATSTQLNGRVGVRKNILNLVGNTTDILNTPKRVKLVGAGDKKPLSLPREPLSQAPYGAGLSAVGMSDSLMSEHNEFKSLVPHLTSQGAKFLSKVKATSVTGSDLDASTMSHAGGTYNPDFSTFTNTPSPKAFVRNIEQKPRRKFSLLRQRFESEEEEKGRVAADDSSDYKYGFMPENPDAKYGFGVFGGGPAEPPPLTLTAYNLVETAKLSSSPAGTAAMIGGRSVPNIPGAYSLSALNRGSTEFKLGPDQQYANFAREHWSSASLQRRPSRAGLGDRLDAARRSMSILDDYEEKENVGPPRPLQAPKRRHPLAPLNKTSPIKILGSNIHSPQTRVYQLNPTSKSTLSPTSKIFRKKSTE